MFDGVVVLLDELELLFDGEDVLGCDEFLLLEDGVYVLFDSVLVAPCEVPVPLLFDSRVTFEFLDEDVFLLGSAEVGFV